MTRRHRPARAPLAALTYPQALAASESRRMAADDLILRGMLQDSIRRTALPPRGPA